MAGHRTSDLCRPESDRRCPGYPRKFEILGHPPDTNRCHFIFIAGTDTGVGKTVLTSLLLSHLRQRGVRALALKPFCSGGRSDAELLHTLQNRELSLDDINPFYFEDPVTPLVAARHRRREIPLSGVLRSIRIVLARLALPELTVQSSKFKVQSSSGSLLQSANPPIHRSTNPFLLIEGAGGLLSPLGENFNLLTLIQRVNRARSERRKVTVLVAAANRLGTINHTLLTVRRLQEAGIKKIAVVLTELAAKEQATPDSTTNGKVLQELLHPVPLFHLPYSGRGLADASRLHATAKARRVLLGKMVSAFNAP